MPHPFFKNYGPLSVSEIIKYLNIKYDKLKSDQNITDIKDLFTASIRVFTISLIIMVTWFSHFWGEQKSSLKNPNIYIYGVSVLNSNYYIQYLTSSFDGKILHLDPNAILDKMYEHPFIKAARVSYRYPDKIILEISERIPFARVNNHPDNMIMLDEHCFVIPNIEEVKK